MKPADTGFEPRLESLEPRLLLDGQTPTVDLFNASPALFAENQGQWADALVQYAFQHGGAGVAFTDAGLAIHLAVPVETGDPTPEGGLPDPLREDMPPTEYQTTVVAVRFEGATAVAPTGLDRQETLFNYFVGDQANWRSEVPTYAAIGYAGLYDGIDLQVSGDAEFLKYAFHVAAGADWRQIGITYDGAAGLLEISTAGDLVIHTAAGDLVDRAPVAWQEIGGQRVDVAVTYQLIDADTIVFAVSGDYDPSTELVIDPYMAWSTYLGGTGSEYGYNVAIDPGGVYVTGSTNSSGWVSGGWDTSYNGGTDAFVAKVSPDGTQLLWSTYLGGSGSDYAEGIAVDGIGGVYVAGRTASSGWVSGGFDTSFNGGTDAFVANLDGISGTHVWSTYLGGSGTEYGYGVAADTLGVYVTGSTTSSGWVAGGFDTSFNGGTDAFVAGVSTDGGHLWSSYLGGPYSDYGEAVATDGIGGVYATGRTGGSVVGWVRKGFDTSFNGGTDAFVVKLRDNTGMHVWSTYLGGVNTDNGYGIAADDMGRLYVSGSTNSVAWVLGGFDTSLSGTDGFVAAIEIWPESENHPPEAQDDAVSTDEDVSGVGGNVLANDTDEDGDWLEVVLVDGVGHGSLALNADGSFSYQPYLDFSGSDRFTYKATDGTAESNVATVWITVGPINDVPLAVSDAYVAYEATQLTVGAPGLLANDWDVDGDSLAAVLLSDPANGSLVLAADGSFVYTPGPGFVGKDVFTYAVSDGQALSAAGTVRVTVWPTSPPPTPQLVMDINRDTANADPGPFVEMGGVAFFFADDGVHGPELWKSDGTPEGTVMVKDIRSGPIGSFESVYRWYNHTDPLLTNVNGVLFFICDDGVHGDELWKSDGTSEGTTLVKDIWPGGGRSINGYLTDVNGTLFFSAHDTVHGTELWKSDGTADGTVMVKDIFPGNGAANPEMLTNVSGTLFFAAADGVHGCELWKTDGTPEGTVMVKDIVAGGSATRFDYATAVGTTLFFTADDGVHGMELWKSDGTEGGTFLLKDIGSPHDMINVNGTLFFGATGGLWKSDGTAAGTVLVSSVALSSGVAGLPHGAGGAVVANVGGSLFFSGSSGGTGYELWKSDGTAAGTALVKNINPSGSASSYPTDLVVVGSALYFTADDGVNGRELWRSDGTAEGTVLVKDVFAGSATSWICFLANAGGKIFFRADGGTVGSELWTSDGTTSGTVLLKDINSGDTADSLVVTGYEVWPEFVEFGGDIFFAANDGVTGRETGPTFVAGYGGELWKTDGTAAGTTLVKDIVTGAYGSGVRELTVVGRDLFFQSGHGLWRTDGTPEGTLRVGTWPGFPEYLTNVNGILYFRVSDGSHGNELWRSDGTSAGTFLVKDIALGSKNSDPADLVDVNGTLVFTADDGVHGRELWKSDGTPQGTVIVKDVRPGTAGLTPVSRNLYLTKVNGTLFFVATDGVNGDELWKSDGTPEGTVLVRDLRPGSANSYAMYLTELNGEVYFSAADGGGNGLWKSDGTEAGTVLVKRITADPGSADTRTAFLAANGKLYFTASYSGYGSELWESDGTDEGTVMVKDIRPGSSGSDVSWLANANGTVFFAANDGVHGLELWRSDGTAAGTFMVKDIAPGEEDSNLQRLTYANGMLIFGADDGSTGWEPWMYVSIPMVSVPNQPPVASDDSYTIDEDQTLAVDAPGVLGNDTDVDGDALAAMLVSEPSNGALMLNADGSFTYTPAPNFNGNDSFAYKANDGTADGNVATVTVTVNPVNDAPVAGDLAVGTDEDTPLVGLVTASDVEGDRLAFALVSAPANGSVTLAENGSFTYTPAANFNGADAFTYKANDGTADSNVATVTITVNPVNDAPVAGSQSASVDEDGSVEITLTVTDVETPADQLVFTITTAPAHGTLGLVSGNRVTYTPSANYNGPDSFAFTVTDDGDPAGSHANPGDLTSDPATVSITVKPVNDAPVASGQSVTTDEDQAVVIALGGSDTETPAEGLVFTITRQPDHGTVSLSGNLAGYTPALDYSGPDSFAFAVTDTGDPAGSHVNPGDLTSQPATVSLYVNNLSDLSGRVFDDLDDDGVFEPEAGELGLGGVTMRLTGTDDRGPVERAVVTDPDGSYLFTDLRPGNYTVAEAEQPGGLLDGDETAGALGGVVDNTQHWNAISQIVVRTDDPDAPGYTFAEIRPSSAHGLVWEDFNNDGEVNFGEKAVAGVTISLAGIDDRGGSVSQTLTTDEEGIYGFFDLRPGDYSIRETQPAGFEDGLDVLGTVNGVPTGQVVANDDLGGIVLPQPESFAENYNFGERPMAGGAIVGGQTATIGFWQNKNGQSLIQSLNGGAASTQLGDWLAATFTNMFGAESGANDLAGKTNAEVAAYYQRLFKMKGPKLDAQVMAVALAVYATNSTLAGSTASAYGFRVTELGVGIATFNVGSGGAAFDVADNTTMMILDILVATDRRTTGGVLYGGDQILRNLANTVYTAINESGDR